MGWPVHEYADIRQSVCQPCLDGNDAEIRRCTTINCPFWPYRMGRNPHNPQRGKNHVRSYIRLRVLHSFGDALALVGLTP